MEMINHLIFEMININQTDTRRINHALKVYGLAKCIAGKEKLPPDIMQIVEAAAILHDIAIRFCEAKHGSGVGHLQEKEGPLIARPILEKYTNDQTFIDRVLYIIAHHHSYKNIDGIDHQIVVEADLLVNTDEEDISMNAFKNMFHTFFQTNTAKEIARKIFNDI